MGEEKNLTWREEGPNKDDVILRAQDGEDIAHIFPADGKAGYTLCVKDHGGWWSDTPGRHYDTLHQAQHHALEHGKDYYQQEERNLSEANRHHLIHDLEEQWQRMGGDPKTMTSFRNEWDRVSAAEHNLKVAERER